MHAPEKKTWKNGEINSRATATEHRTYRRFYQLMVDHSSTQIKGD